ncbi:serine hydrolase domain-containing protein [Frigoriflavimonas asaccharolytica]|uniref:CubicO group peptidase (Beta-lactamase class C family) n=1 Tax=Frigoriflavimonas asaccharolytica TaxID=2735899 RepID=A0A8J8KAD0_9FLAO|nr:serine hydrolase domain-containing protein [Frigoriflavimonas asaccharolytica]NRS91354.1 CubicO group peptidase (beta-lactamase class C family) [Frigoriflavimonas asaccharolytica]
MGKLFTVSLLFFIVNFSLAQNSKTQRLDSLFAALQSENAFNGNVLIAEKGVIIFEKSYGFANEENKIKLNLQTKFELASVSKQFTAMGIVLLEKKGDLEYTDNISKYIPELASYGEITIKNLLNHTGGLPDYIEIFDQKWDKTKFATNEDIATQFAKYKPTPDFKPNEKYEYSNTGYAILGLIIERVSKKSFGEFLKNYIFKPLKMENTFVYRSRFQPEKIKNHATGYVIDSLGNKVTTDSFGKDYYTYYLDGIVGDGMVNSTLEDLLKWDRALQNNILVNDDDKNLIFCNSQTLDGKDNNYGFGWILADSKKYGKIAYHSGGWAGYSTFIEREISNDKTIILLQNNSIPSTVIPAAEVRKILYNEAIISKKKIELKSEDLDKFLGIYSTPDFPLKITLTKKDFILFAKATGQEEFPLDAYENNTFKFIPANITIEFIPTTKSFIFTQENSKIKFTKE